MVAVNNTNAGCHIFLNQFCFCNHKKLHGDITCKRTSQYGAGINIKHMCDLDVIRGKVRIQNAKDLYEHLHNIYRSPTASTFPSRAVKLAERVLKAVIETERACYLKRSRETAKCTWSKLVSNLDLFVHIICLATEITIWIKNYVDNWTKVDVQRETTTERRATRSDKTEELTSFIARGSTVAIAAADGGKDFYLFKVTGNGEEILQQGKRDSYNCRYCVGNKVFRGHFIITFWKISIILLWIKQNKQ